jgi:hypothetical protein
MLKSLDVTESEAGNEATRAWITDAGKRRTNRGTERTSCVKRREAVGEAATNAMFWNGSRAREMSASSTGFVSFNSFASGGLASI